ncbi:MAG TPA: hypothetical protein VEC36_06940 [Patescibacteria group bacterium]|nr:hypothetical protein [Patescibacteria group bacterium]
MDSAEIIEILEARNAFVHGHFIAPDGRHTDMDFCLVKALQFPPYCRKIAYEIVKHYWDMDIQLVISVRLGGVLLAAEIARQLEARVVYTRSTHIDDEPELLKGFEIHAGDRVLLIDEILTDDIYHFKTIAKKVLKEDARLVGIGVAIDLSTQPNIMNVRQISALQMKRNIWPADECALCRAGEKF